MSKLIETGIYKVLGYVLMALVIAGLITVPMVFYVKGPFWGRFVAALWTLMVVSVAAWFATKTLKVIWRRR